MADVGDWWCASQKLWIRVHKALCRFVTVCRALGAYKLPAEDLTGFSLLSAVAVASESLSPSIPWRRHIQWQCAVECAIVIKRKGGRKKGLDTYVCPIRILCSLDYILYVLIVCGISAGRLDYIFGDRIEWVARCDLLLGEVAWAGASPRCSFVALWWPSWGSPSHQCRVSGY